MLSTVWRTIRGAQQDRKHVLRQCLIRHYAGREEESVEPEATGKHALKQTVSFTAMHADGWPGPGDIFTVFYAADAFYQATPGVLFPWHARQHHVSTQHFLNIIEVISPGTSGGHQ
jgi:hypothetical protein